jgi:hypothetical protein
MCELKVQAGGSSWRFKLKAQAEGSSWRFKLKGSSWRFKLKDSRWKVGAEGSSRRFKLKVQAKGWSWMCKLKVQAGGSSWSFIFVPFSSHYIYFKWRLSWGECHSRPEEEVAILGAYFDHSFWAIRFWSKGYNFRRILRCSTDDIPGTTTATHHMHCFKLRRVPPRPASSSAYASTERQPGYKYTPVRMA